MQKGRGLIFRTMVLFIAFSLFTTSIVFAEMFTPLKKDKLPNAKASSVIFGRVYMTSQFESFNKAPGKTYVFKGSRYGDQKNLP